MQELVTEFGVALNTEHQDFVNFDNRIGRHRDLVHDFALVRWIQLGFRYFLSSFFPDFQKVRLCVGAINLKLNESQNIRKEADDSLGFNHLLFFKNFRFVLIS